MKNREIKFRIWNGSKMEHNIMAGFLGAFYVQGIDEKDSASMSPFNTKYFDTIPVMQYTGLKDKAGNDIYEGDILEVITKALPSGKDASGDTYLGEVKFDYGEYVISFKDKFGFNNALKNWALNHSKVLGNIFENSELLTTQAGGV